jgi:hypothetical protein
MLKLTPNLIVPSVELCLPFWVTRLGFTKTVEVPAPDGATLGFVILKRDAVELMLQSVASLASDVPPLGHAEYHSVLYLEVPDLAPIRAALEGWPLVIPERTTFYGAHEIIVTDPAGNHIFFGAHGSG